MKILKDEMINKSAEVIDDKKIEKEKDILMLPATYPQRQLWVLNLMYQDNAAYNIPLALRIKGNFDYKSYSKALNLIIEKNYSFRTTFNVINGLLNQIIHPNIKIEIPFEDYSSNQFELDKRIRKIASSPFDLNKGPLLRSYVFQLSANENIVFILFHHIVIDHKSIKNFLNELSLTYNSFVSSLPFEQHNFNMQYVDYVKFENNEDAESTSEKLNYWKNHLEGDLPLLQLPQDYSRPQKQSLKGNEIETKFSKALGDALRDISYKENKPLLISLLSAFKILLFRLSGQKEIVVGYPFANRTIKDLDDMIGLLMNTLPIRTTFNDELTFNDVLNNVNENFIKSEKNQSIAFEQIVEELHPHRDASYNPLFQVNFNYKESYEVILDGANVEEYYVHNETSKFDLSLSIIDSKEELTARLEYSSDIFNENTAKRILKYYEQLLTSITEKSNEKISEIKIIPNEEENLILNTWNDTVKEYPNKSLTQLFEEQVSLTPNKIAISFKDKDITYFELNRRANKLAGFLKEKGVKKDVLVGLSVDRSIEMVVCLLAIQKAGGAYVPLDPAFPHDRLVYMTQDSELKILISQNKYKDIFKDADLEYIGIEDLDKFISSYSDENPKYNYAPDALAYVIYTSGSTGKPKGVQIQQQALVNFLISMQDEPGIKEDDVLLSVTTLSFDIAGLELYLPLITGAKLVVVSKETTMDAKLLQQALRDNKATIMQATPATWRMLLETGWTNQEKIKILCGGEALPRDLVDKLTISGAELWNMYGPTETTIWSTVKLIKKDEDVITIGRPINNTQIYILDHNLQPVPIGVKGDLYIGGDGLAKGYLNNEKLTAERFIDSPFIPGKKIYKSGDLTRYLADGRIEHLGRSDFQVKIRGFRIELEEIEVQLNKYDKLKNAVVVAREDKSGLQSLCAYVIPKNGEKSVSEIKEFLKKSLPDYMIPTAYFFIDEFPLTPNGKIDRKALLKLDGNVAEDTKEFVVAKDDVEKKLLKIWENILNISPISTQDNFFEIGGHSLLAATMFAHVEEEFNIKIPLAILFSSPTVLKLAEVIRMKNHLELWSSLVPIKAFGNGTPLFLVHGAEGNVLLYRELADSLDDDQPVYGLQSQGLDGLKNFNPKFEEVAEYYINEIKKIQPKGPYLLGGYCLGGTIAYEMAQQLKQKGESVALLAMLETYNLQANPDAMKFPYTYYHKIQNLYFHFNNFIKANSKNRIEFVKQKAETTKFRFKVRLENVVAKLTNNKELEDKYPHIRVQKINDQAEKDYQPQLYNGKITLFKPAQDFKGMDDPFFGWKGLASEGVKVYALPVSPRGMLVEPYVKILAEHLKKEIDDALKNEFKMNISSN